jgi:enterochelin esterase-like enzyme
MEFDRHVEGVTGDSSPIIDGEKVVFFYRGDAGDVYLTGDYNQWALEDKMNRLENGAWYIRKAFPKNARFDYKYVVDGNWITDPLNQNVSPGGSGDNSTLVMPEYRSDYEKIVRASVPGGRLIRDIRHESRYLRKEMRCHIYLPVGFEQGRINFILYALDGSDYLNYARIDRILDYMIYHGEIPEMVAVLVDPDDRDTEFTIHEPFYNYVVHELMPEVESAYMGGVKAMKRPAFERSAIGVSWGGLTAIYLAAEKPFAFGRVLSQSGSFWPKDWRIFDKVAACPARGIRFCLQTGTIQDTEEMNDAMAGLLKEKGYGVDYQKYAETHSWFNWKGHLNEGLKKLFRY